MIFVVEENFVDSIVTQYPTISADVYLTLYYGDFPENSVCTHTVYSGDKYTSEAKRKVLLSEIGRKYNIPEKILPLIPTETINEYLTRNPHLCSTEHTPLHNYVWGEN